ncbi:MAG: TonB-dependent receptor [Saprospiraceae bacterium]
MAYGLSVFGTVVDEQGSQLDAVLVYAINSNSSFMTNDDGFFNIDVGDLGEETLVFQLFGYETKKVNVTKNDFDKLLKVELQKITMLSEIIEIKAEKKTIHGFTKLRAVEGMSIYSAKKAVIIDLESLNANLASNSARQIFSKVSGLNIWESDCSGLQLGVGSRGLSPTRTSNFNVRQNGYDVSADAIGYPDAYYAPPMQALQSIEIIKGAASLQYGTQFGGLINFKLKDAPKDKTIQWNSVITYGSNKYFNSFNRLSGTIGNLSYNTFFQYRKGDCFRENSDFDYQSSFASIKYQLTPKVIIGIEYTNLGYLAHQAGGLTDKLFYEDAQQSIRDNNWFKIYWNLLNFKVNYKLSSKTTIESFVLGQYAGRDASGFLGKISRTDPLTENSLLKDEYNNIIVESKILHKTSIYDKLLVHLLGVRYMKGHTTKKQGDTNEGKATFTYNNANYLEGSDYRFKSNNLSVFTENILNVTDKFSIVLGGRMEYINQDVDGYYRFRNFDFAGNILLDTSFNETKKFARSFVFFGGGLSYKHNENLEFYTNFSQNYRAVGYNDLRIVNPNLVIDPEIKDERGYNFDIGIKGNSKSQLIFYDANFFVLKYQNKIGNYLKKIPDPILIERVVRYRTNISAATSFGLEMFAQADLFKIITDRPNDPLSISLYSNLSIIKAVYSDSKESAFHNKKIEDVPAFTSRLGIDFQYDKLRMGIQYSFTDRHFSDATNAIFVADATVGIIPSYSTFDFNVQYQWNKIGLQLAINNFMNSKYFTRRSDGYPGPGILPAEPINANLTFTLRL